jgi:flagellar protein FlaG
MTVFVAPNNLATLRRGPISYRPQTRLHFHLMNNPTQPNVKLTNDADYRENYANSVQMRVNIWDFFLVFGTLQQQTESHVEIKNFQGIYLSPQQAKALLGLLQQNVGGYESAFGEIKLDPRMNPQGPVH